MNSPASQGRFTPGDHKDHLPEILDRVQEGIAAYDLGLNFTYLNNQCAKILHCDPDAVIGKNLITVFPETKDSLLSKAHEQAVHSLQPVQVVDYFPPGNCWLESRIFPSEEGVTVLYMDVTERRRAEIARQKPQAEEEASEPQGSSPALARPNALPLEKTDAQLHHTYQELDDDQFRLEKQVLQRTEELRQANRALRTLTNCNHALVRSTTVNELMASICHVLVNDGGYRMAWIGSIEQDEARTIRPLAWAGHEAGYLETVHITWTENERGRGPTGTAARTHQVSSSRDILVDSNLSPWRAEAQARGYRSSIGLPLLYGNEILGVLTIYSTRPEAFDEAEKALLVEFSNDVAYGWAALRSRAAQRMLEERFTKAFQSNPAALVITRTSDQVRVDVNESYIRLTGYSREELLGTSTRILTMLASPEDTQKIARMQAANEPIRDFESQIITKNGDVREILLSLDPINIDAEPFSVGTIVDITERRKLEIAIRNRVNELTCIQQVSRLLESGTGTNPEGIAEEITRLIIPAMQYSDIAVAAIEIDGQRFISPLSTGSIPVHHLVSDIMVNNLACGQVIVGYTSDLPFIIPEEQDLLDSLTRAFGLWVERKQAETALRESNERFRQLADQIQEVFWIRDLQDSKVLYISPAYELIWGRTCQDLMKNSAEYLESIAPEDRPGYLDGLQRLAKGERVELEYRIRQTNGSCRWIWERSFPISNEIGQAVRSAGVATDITAIKVAQQDLEELNRTLELHVQDRTVQLRQSRDDLSIANVELEKASRLKNEFLASMSHELRTPLTGILGLSEALLLDTYGEFNERQRKALSNIEKSGRHLLDLINDILDLSKIEAGKLEFQFSICSASEIAHSSLQLIMGLAQQRNQRVGFKTNSNAILLRADPRRLKQMLVNLFSNAVKFTPEGGELGLEIEGDESNQIARFTVWDRGIGIKPEDMNKLFKAFVQIDSSLSRQYSGTGLGLALVQRMAERHGGSVELTSVLGEGSRFSIVLPWVTSDRVPGDTLILKPYTRKTKDTLTIEENQLDADNVTRYLNALGVVNHVYPQAVGAAAKAAALRPGIILVDLNLPDGSGMEVLKELKSDLRTNAIPVIVTSVEDHRAETAALGADGYLEKPFAMLDLHGEIARVAANARAQDPAVKVSGKTSTPVMMIADDNEIILETLSEFCISQNYIPVAARGGYELLDRVVEVHPDIIMVDIQMPGLDGNETIRRLRAHSQPEIAAIPIIAFTDLALAGDREITLQAGANEYIRKPISLPQLVQLLAQYMSAKNASA